MKTKKRFHRMGSLALVLAGALLLCLGLRPDEQPTIQLGAAPAAADRFQAEMDSCFDQIRFGDVELKKEYVISDPAAPAPMPNPDCYGEAESPGELKWLLKKAEELLDGQTLKFSADTVIFPGSTIHYYLDETILAITWKELIDNVPFTFSEVKLAHPSQFRRYLSGGEFGSGILSKSTEMSASVNAVVAGNGDYYAYRRKGITVTEGIVRKYIPGVPDNCFIDQNGNLILERDLVFADEKEAQAYVDANGITFSLSFGPILVKDGEYVCPRNYPLGGSQKGFPRAAICQMDDLHYLFAASNMEIHYYTTLTMTQFAQRIFETGCRHAYALDGGQTATVVMNNELMNNVNYGSERLISDIIYFATAKNAGA